MMKSPIIVVESNDIGVYRSPEHALSHLELYDIKKGIYTAYDSEGLLLDFRTGFAERERKFLWFRWIERFETAILKEHEPETNCLEVLREKLVYYLTGNKDDKKKSLQEASLRKLIAMVAKDMPWKL